MSDDKKDPTEIHYINQTRYLEAKDLEMPTYEPKRNFRWIFNVDNLDSFVLYTIEMPKWVGPFGWQPFKISMYDPIVPSATQKVYDWIQKKDKRNATLVLLDPVGTVVEKWNYEGLLPDYVDFGKLDYSNKKAKIITVQFSLTDVILEF